MTFEEILTRLLERVPDTLDKREGSILYNALAPAAMELSEMYGACEQFLKDTFADTAQGNYLTRRAQELGIGRKAATYAVRKGTFSYANGDDYPLEIGARFMAVDELYPLAYQVTEKLADGYALTCQQAGEIGNYPLGALLPVDYLDGLATATLGDILIAGSDEESDDSLRRRYFASLEGQAYGGNVADYREKVNALSGVGGVKVYPVWQGGGTVKLVIIDDRYEKPEAALVDQVQTAVDPEANSGEGYGIAPIGHKVTVVGVEEVAIQVSCQYTLLAGYSWKDVQPYLEEAYQDYLAELRESWAQNSQLVVRTAYLDTRALSVVGVLDVEHTAINGSEANLVLTDNEIPVLGAVSNV